MRLSANVVAAGGVVKSGYDYDRQCWVENYIVQRCGHPEKMECQCFGKIFAGEDVRELPKT